MVELVDALDSKELGDRESAPQGCEIRKDLQTAGRCQALKLVDLSTTKVWLTDVCKEIFRLFEN